MPTVDARTGNNPLGRLATDYHSVEMESGFFCRDLDRSVGVI